MIRLPCASTPVGILVSPQSESPSQQSLAESQSRPQGYFQAEQALNACGCGPVSWRSQRATGTCPCRPVPASSHGSGPTSCPRRSCSCDGSRSSGQETTIRLPARSWCVGTNTPGRSRTRSYAGCGFAREAFAPYCERSATTEAPSAAPRGREKGRAECPPALVAVIIGLAPQVEGTETRRRVEMPPSCFSPCLRARTNIRRLRKDNEHTHRVCRESPDGIPTRCLDGNRGRTMSSSVQHGSSVTSPTARSLSGRLYAGNRQTEDA